jgi:hypothetical protein
LEIPDLRRSRCYFEDRAKPPANAVVRRQEIAQALEVTWDAAHLFEFKQLLKAWDFYQDQLHKCDKEYAKAAGNMPDQTQGRPLPEPDKRP